MKKKKIKNSLDMQERAKKRVPGGTQLLSKRSEMFAPNQWPGYFSSASGVHVYDLDNNKYLDMSIMGIGANVLGYCDPDVDTAVKECIQKGNSSSLNCAEEIILADLMTELHPWSSMVRYSRSGGEAMALAVRIGRAHSKRDRVAFCGYHGWHDWYLAANLNSSSELEDHLLPGLEPNGVPKGLEGTALAFKYNDIDSLKKLLKQYPGEIGTIVMEPLRSEYPKVGFLEEIREIANQNEIVLIFDEITAAFRINNGGSHLEFKIDPDIAVFAKAVSNGYPMSVILGTEEVMQSAQSTFISSTYWTERIGPTAAIATIQKFMEKDVSSHLNEIGNQIQKIWKECAAAHDLDIHVSGLPALSHFSFNYTDGQAMMTLFVQLMLTRGILASNRFYASYAHEQENVDEYKVACDDVFSEIKDAIEKDELDKVLLGPVAQSGFKRLN
tara:strand:+ start:3154 stop:4479 length:1326 start_codon:yes stop_codon:yes gene_type:complete